MTEEKPTSWAPIMIKLFLLIVLTGLPIAGMLTLLVLAGVVPNSWIGQTLLITGFVFLFGAGLLLATKNVLYWAYSLLVGFAIGIGCIVLAFLAILSMISVPLVGNAAWLVIIISVILVSSIMSHLWDRKNPLAPKEIPVITTSSKAIRAPRLQIPSIRKKQSSIVSVELVELPRDYAYSEDKKHSVSEMVERFHSIVRHLTLSSVPFALRFQRMHWKTRVMFLTWSNDETKLHHYQTVLYDTLSSNLSGFKFQKTHSFEGIDLDVQDTGSVVSVIGVPLSIEEDAQRKDPLESMTSVLQELENGIVQITLTPSGIDKSQLSSLESRYRAAVEQSETTVSKTKSGLFSGDRQESKTIVNPEKKRHAEALQRKVERLSNPYLCRVAVTTAAWGQDIATSNLNAHRIASALIGAIRPDNKMEEFQLEHRNKRTGVIRILHGISISNTTTLTPKEATTYFILPRTDIGIRVTAREKFSSGTQESAITPTKATEEQDRIRSLVPSKVKWLRRVPMIFFGNPIDERGNLLEKSYVLLDPNKFDMHLGIFGNIRFGKTWTAISVVSQAITLGINPIVLVPSKGYEWRKLIDIFPDIRIFTCGNDKAALLS
ncbi:MAG: Yip1 family protein, partial [Candidatus Thorarchaeota archaeon]